MKLRGIEFGKVWQAAGVNGFKGEGWPHHRLLKPLGLTFAGTTFVSKTVTLFGRDGNEPLIGDSRIKFWWWPRSIRVDWLRLSNMINAFGLGNYGLGYYLPCWQEFTEPFIISVASAAVTQTERLQEHRIMCSMLAAAEPCFKARFGIQIDLSCPTAGWINPEEWVLTLECYSPLTRVPKIPKVSVAMPTAEIYLLSQHADCDAICTSNTVPLDWDGFGSSPPWRKSPFLKRFGVPGGVSGAPLKQHVIRQIQALQQRGITKPINAGGGIMSPSDVFDYWNETSQRDGPPTKIGSVFLGSVATLRPWRMRKIIAKAKGLPWHQ